MFGLVWEVKNLKVDVGSRKIRMFRPRWVSLEGKFWATSSDDSFVDVE